MTILEKHGIEVFHEQERALLQKHGARVDGVKVYFPPALVEAQLKAAPGEFTLHARNPEKSVSVGGNEEHIALETIMHVGSGGNYLAEDHTFRHMRDLRSPIVSSRKGYTGEGDLPDTARRAREVYLDRLAAHEAPALDPKVEADLLSYMEKLA